VNTRPSRVPSPPPTQETEFTDSIEFVEQVAQTNNLPAQARTQEQRMNIAKTVSERIEAPEPELPATGPGGVIAAIAAIMAEIKPVEKLGWNDFQKYTHVRMQDLSRELTPLMGKHGIVVFQTEEGRELFDNGNAVAVRYRFTVVHKSGEIWPQRPLQTGVSACRNTKGGFDDKALNKCHTAARKYFLLSLFQIASEDEQDADQGPAPQRQPQQRPAGRRPVPSPDGKVPPHILPVVEGEAPAAWAARFNAFIEKASSRAEIDAWYDTNKAVFEKLQNADEQVYNDALDFMDACEAKLAKPKPDPISSGNGGQRPRDDGFPGDKTLPTVNQTVKWLEELDEAFAKCTDTEELASEQESIMLPSKDTVTKQTWAAAMAIVKKHLERIQNG